jgi:energy-converting hydrogenase Eha subunit E
MDWTFTLALLAAGIVLTVFYSVRGARRKDPLSVPLIPPTALLFLGVLLILLAGSHALTLMGIEHNRAQLRP